MAATDLSAAFFTKQSEELLGLDKRKEKCKSNRKLHPTKKILLTTRFYAGLNTFFLLALRVKLY